MDLQSEGLEALKNNRVGHIQKMLDDEKRELLKKVNRHNQALVSSSTQSISQRNTKATNQHCRRESSWLSTLSKMQPSHSLPCFAISSFSCSLPKCKRINNAETLFKKQKSLKRTLLTHFKKLPKIQTPKINPKLDFKNECLRMHRSTRKRKRSKSKKRMSQKRRKHCGIGREAKILRFLAMLQEP